MHDELTAVDIKKMEQEVEYRRLQLRPQLLEDVKTAREFGDLSENFEYKAAKREKNRNDSRIRYLERMIKTAKVIDASSNPDEIGLFDKVTIYIEEDDEEQTIELVTTLRQNALKGLISKESPVGKAVMGHKKGDRVTVHVNETYSYDIVIRDVQKGSDDETLPIKSPECPNPRRCLRQIDNRCRGASAQRRFGRKSYGSRQGAQCPASARRR